jgi:AraC family transcriptional regulator
VGTFTVTKECRITVDPARFKGSLRFIQENFRKNPTLAEIARHSHMSQFHFHRLASLAWGETPKAIVFRLQIDEAKRLLSRTKTELAEIAVKCGFAHQSHFTGRFRQAVGVTPARYRSEQRKEAASAA